VELKLVKTRMASMAWSQALAMQMQLVIRRHGEEGDENSSKKTIVVTLVMRQMKRVKSARWARLSSRCQHE